MEQITTVGIDLAKNVFSLHGVDAAGKTVLRRTVRRDRLVETVASLSRCNGIMPRGRPPPRPLPRNILYSAQRPVLLRLRAAPS